MGSPHAAAELPPTLLESAEMVPMDVPPGAQVRFRRKRPAEKRDRNSIRAFACDLSVPKKCRLLC